MFDGTEDWCKIWRKTDFCFLKIFVYRLKNSNFILESKMAELNQNKNSKQPDRPDGKQKFFLPWDKCIAQLTKLFARVLQNLCS